MARNIFGFEIPDPMPYDWHWEDSERRRLEREALENYVPDDREMYKPHYEGQNVRGPFASRPGIVTNQEDTEREPPAVDEDDYLNQLMMAALMKGGKGGKMGQLAGASGGDIPFGDPWSMRAPWEKDYRYLS
jgi:hypothetical protein